MIAGQQWLGAKGGLPEDRAQVRPWSTPRPLVIFIEQH